MTYYLFSHWGSIILPALQPTGMVCQWTSKPSWSTPTRRALRDFGTSWTNCTPILTPLPWEVLVRWVSTSLYIHPLILHLAAWVSKSYYQFINFITFIPSFPFLSTDRWHPRLGLQHQWILSLCVFQDQYRHDWGPQAIELLIRLECLSGGFLVTEL